jgi:hypothetical protein
MRLFTLHHGRGHTSARVGRLTALVLWPLLFRRPSWLAPFWHLVLRAGAFSVVWQGRP